MRCPTSVATSYGRSSGTPILIVRGRDNQIRAFYNTCTHRGGPLVRQESGQEKVFVCKYHCWAFSLDGALNHIPDEHEFIAVDKSKRGLKSVRCEMFGNWIYINRDADAMPLEEFLGPVIREYEDFKPQSCDSLPATTSICAVTGRSPWTPSRRSII